MAKRCKFGFFCRRPVIGTCRECGKNYCDQHGLLNRSLCRSCQDIIQQMEARMSLNPKYAARKHATSKNFQRLCGYQDCTHEPVKECGVCSRQFCDDHVHHTWYTVWGDPSMPTRTGDPPVITMQGDVCPNCQNWKDIEVRYELGQELIEIENEYKSRIKK